MYTPPLEPVRYQQRYSGNEPENEKVRLLPQSERPQEAPRGERGAILYSPVKQNSVTSGKAGGMNSEPEMDLTNGFNHLNRGEIFTLKVFGAMVS